MALRNWLTAFAVLCLGLCSSAAYATQIYTTQGYYDYTMSGVGFRRVNSSNVNVCRATSDANYWEPNAPFSVTVPTGQRIEKAYLFWGGSSDVVDTTATLSLNGGAGSTVTATSSQTASVNNYRYYEVYADVTSSVSAAAPSGGTINVTVSGVTFKATNPDGWRNSCGAAGAVTMVIVYTTDYTNAAIAPRAVVVDDVTNLLHNSAQATYNGSISGVASAATTPNARATFAIVEGDGGITNNEAFSFAGTSYPIVYAQGDTDRTTLNGGGDSWELETLNPTIAAGATSTTYSLTTGNDLIMPVVMAMSWNVQSEYGDAPASYGIARHTPADLGDSAAALGNTIDFEGSSQFSTDANGDDSAGATPDDENGVSVLPKLTVADTSYTVTTNCRNAIENGASRTAYVSAWIDFNRNGTFDSNEIAQGTCNGSSVTLNWTISPTQIVAGQTYIRLRVAKDQSNITGPTGNALSGEVEDYSLDIAPVVKANKTVWPEADDGVFNFSANGTTIATNIGDDQNSGWKTLYPKQLNNYNGMTGFAPDVTMASVATGARAVTMTETGGTNTPLSAYTTAINCVNGAGTTVYTSASSASANFTLPQSVTGTTTNGPLQQVTCSYVNQTARIVVIKNTSGGDGTFHFDGTGNLTASFDLTTASGTATNAAQLARIYPVNANETVTETVPSGWKLTAIGCTFTAPDGTTGTTGTVTSPAVSLNLSAGYEYICTFTNTKDATLTLAKTIVNDNGGTATLADFILTAAGPVTIQGASGSASVTAQPITPGSYTLSETVNPLYVASVWTCTNGVTVDANGVITLGAGVTTVCTINNNDTNEVQLSITKTNNATEITSGTSTTYTVTVNNAGPAKADGALVQDTPGTGLSGCVVQNCTGANGAVCPANPGNIMTGPVAIPTLPANGSVTFTVTCNVN